MVCDRLGLHRERRLRSRLFQRAPGQVGIFAGRAGPGRGAAGGQKLGFVELRGRHSSKLRHRARPGTGVRILARQGTEFFQAAARQIGINAGRKLGQKALEILKVV